MVNAVNPATVASANQCAANRPDPAAMSQFIAQDSQRWRALATRYALATAPALVVLELAALASWPDPMLPFWLAGAVALAGPLAALVDGENRTLYERGSGTRLVRLNPAAGSR